MAPLSLTASQAESAPKIAADDLGYGIDVTSYPYYDFIMTSPVLSEIQRAATYGDILLSRHAEERCDERSVRATDIKRAIKTATSAVVQGNDAILVSGGVDVSGDALNIVCQLVRRGVYIITVIGA